MPPNTERKGGGWHHFRITPTGKLLETDELTSEFEQLHAALGEATVECLLVSEAETDEVAWYIGSDGQHTSLRRVFERILPESYELTPVETDPLPSIESDATVAELHGLGERRDDWQTRLRPPVNSSAPAQHETARLSGAPGLPFGSLVQGMRQAPGCVVYQTLLKSHPDWTADAEFRVRRLDRGEDTLGSRIVKSLLPPPESIDDESTTTPAHRRGDIGSVPGSRIASILAKSSRASFAVNGRLLATGPEAPAVLRDLGASFNPVGGDFYTVFSVAPEAKAKQQQLYDAVTERTFRDGSDLRTRIRHLLPLAVNLSSQIVADSTTVPHFCLLDGGSLSDGAHRALRSVPAERTPISLPDADRLEPYRESGLALGRPQTMDDGAVDPISLPPTLQSLHVAWFGKTGSGKSTSLVNAILENHAATDGADILIDPKGDGMPLEYMRAHYAKHGDLDGVYYFDCREVLPALSFFDIRPQLEAGISRTSAVADVVDHYVDILRGVMGDDRFGSAVRSPDVIRYLVKALFDPIEGQDAFTHRELEEAAHRLRESRNPPPTSDPDLHRMFEGVTANDERSFDAIMQGVANRIEKVPVDDRLGRIFNHGPDETEGETPEFDFAEFLDEDVVILLDTGGLRTRSQRSLALVLLSNLWTALRQREHAAVAAGGRDGDAPLVNLYLEEAASLAVSDLLSDLLARSRSFGLSVTLAMQFPAQLQAAHDEAYAEVMNNVSTIVAGNVATDDRLARRFATADMDADAVGNRLRALSRGEWFVSLPAPFDEPEPRPFLVESLPLPEGHPEGDAPLTGTQSTVFDAKRALRQRKTREAHGLSIEAQEESPTTQHTPKSATDRPDQITSALPFTDRLPSCIEYNKAAHSLECGHCSTRYGASITGLQRAVECCASMDRVDRDDIPICDLDVRLSSIERAMSDYTDQQLAFLQAVYDGMYGEFTDLEYELRRDSMVRLREYTGLDREAVEALVDDGLINRDGKEPYLLYTVTKAGREELRVRNKRGVTHGDGIGDITETAQHRLMVADGAEFLRQRFVEDEDSPVTAVKAYHEVDENRLDAAGLDDEGDVVVALEAERSNNDLTRAVLRDYDKMADLEVDHAIWLMDGRSTVSAVLEALNDPVTGPVRIGKQYSENTPLSRFTIDTDGWTDVYTIRGIRQRL